MLVSPFARGASSIVEGTAGSQFQIPKSYLIIRTCLVISGHRAVVRALRIENFKQARRAFPITDRRDIPQTFELVEIVCGVKIQNSPLRQIGLICLVDVRDGLQLSLL